MVEGEGIRHLLLGYPQILYEYIYLLTIVYLVFRKEIILKLCMPQVIHCHMLILWNTACEIIDVTVSKGKWLSLV